MTKNWKVFLAASFAALVFLIPSLTLAADNSSVPVASGNETFANKDIGGVHYPKHILYNSSGTEVGTQAAPLWFGFGTGVQLPAFASTPTFNLGTIGAAATEATLSTLNGKVPSLGQALAAASVPVILPSATITTLTPPAAITGFSTSANQTSELTKLDTLHADLGTLNSTATASTPAGENHIGEIASNQIKVQVAQTVTASAYSAGNALGGLMTIANAARASGSAGAAGTGGILTGMQLNSKTIQTGVQVDVFFFDANPTGSTCTDKTAFVIAAADFDKVVGIMTIPSTAANGAGWFGATTTGSVGIPTYYPLTYDLASATSIYACAVVRAAITPAATTDISFKYNILRN